MPCMTKALLVLLYLIVGSLAKDNRILSGSTSSARIYPFMAAFQYTSDNLIFCGGAIISTKHILTAAHCLYYENNSYEHIRVFTGRTVARSRNGQKHTIGSVFIHPLFVGEVSEHGIFQHDIAVVMLSSIIQMNSYHAPIDLPIRDIVNFEGATLLGWGSIEFPIHIYPVKLQRVHMTVYLNIICPTMVEYSLYPGQFCAYNNERIGPCIGDSGGPLVVDGKLAGIMSYMIPCAQGQPDLYTNVHYYKEYITEILRLTS